MTIPIMPVAAVYSQILVALWGLTIIFLCASHHHMSPRSLIVPDIHRSPPLRVAQDGQDWRDALPAKRTLVVQFVSLEKVRDFHKRWPDHEMRFLSTLANASLLLSCPHQDAATIVEDVVSTHGWTFVDSIRHEHVFAHGPLMRYLTPRSVEVLIQPITTVLPRWSMNGNHVPSCIDAGEEVTYSLAYAMYGGAVYSYHLIHLPIIQRFDYFVKLDIDVVFSRRFPFDLGRDMSEKGCSVGHTAIHFSTGCEDGNLEALLAATSALDLPTPKSSQYEWCNADGLNYKSRSIIYGNFQAFSTTLLTDPDVLQVSDYMFETYGKGYFHHRWGDQGAFIAYVCFMLDVRDIHNDAQICDYSSLRGQVFTHPE